MPIETLRRDPETGKFVSDPGDGGSHAQFNDIEVATFQHSIGLDAGSLDGTTGFDGGDGGTFEGLELIDYDELVDRNEELVLLGGSHHLAVYGSSTSTADGTVRGAAEVSASPSRQVVPLDASGFVGDQTGGVQRTTPQDAVLDDSIDLIGRMMAAVGFSPFSDGTTGVGGSGGAGEDTVELGPMPAEMARFHPRDELFLNGALDTWNIADASVHLDVKGQHVYGVIED